MSIDNTRNGSVPRQRPHKDKRSTNGPTATVTIANGCRPRPAHSANTPIISVFRAAAAPTTTATTTGITPLITATTPFTTTVTMATTPFTTTVTMATTPFITGTTTAGMPITVCTA